MSSTPKPLKVTLLTAPQNPLGTLFYVWEQSRTNNPVPSPEEIELLLNSSEELSIESDLLGKIALMLGGRVVSPPDSLFQEVNVREVRERVMQTVQLIFDEDIPCTENLNFVFAIDNMPISLREQMVRHRIGVTIGERTGMDIVPEISKSSWWSQTMRMLPMDKFYTDGHYMIPDSIAEEPVLEAKYLALFGKIEALYNEMVGFGIPMEDARQIMPLGVTHGITWSLNLKAMMHIVGKRACWVAQANLWEGLIAGMVDELAEKVHPIFRKIVSPPCLKKGKYHSCPYFKINRERVQGRDHMPPCPLYVYNETKAAVDASQWSIAETGVQATWSPPKENPQDIMEWDSNQMVERRMLEENIVRYERLWKLNVRTGEPLVHSD